jgi:hypothetical protein
MIRRYRRQVLVPAAILSIAIAAVAGLAVQGSHHASLNDRIAAKIASKDLRFESQGTANGGQGGESAELLAAMQQFDNARTSPGDAVAPGGYSAAYGNLQSLATTGGSWSELTRPLPYDADDPDYRDYFSNSSGGAGLVTGRITGLAADDNGDVYAAAADGGVWRSTTGGGNWTPISDALPSLSSGDLELAPDGSLWYATGEANTGGTSYAGTGVYRLATPKTGTFAATDRVGGNELESTTINSLRFTSTDVWAATLRGVFSHPLGNWSTPWTPRLQPNPSFLPGGANAGVQNSADQNVANDLIIDPKNPQHILAALGWRNGAAYNGFYESTDGGIHWTRINPTGGLDATDIGYANFAYSSDGKKLYVINQSPKRLNKPGFQNTLLDGVYESDSGLPGPWNKIASSDKLGATSTGSALANKQGKGYSPGIQSWYNQSIAVDPANGNHVIVGLEEVYETRNGGSNWTTVDPYWNFYFRCWAPDALYPPNGGPNRCPLAPHTDQHSVTIGKVGGVPTLFIGNDGGVYSHPLSGHINTNGNGDDWKSLNDGTLDALQYYYVGVGKIADNGTRPDLGSGDPVLVSGGLQDNGGSLLRPGAAKMVSNFGGDGGDVLVDPNNGCNIVQEYIYLTMEVTQTCANPGPGHPNAFLDPNDATTYNIAPPDINAQFIAPFTANDKNIDQWVAAGTSLWYQDKGFAIRHPSEWQKIYSLPSPALTFTAVAYSGDSLIATWCGPCSNGGAPFARGAVVGTFDESTRTWTVKPLDLPVNGTVPNRTLQGAAINPNDSSDLFLGINGFSRRYTEGPGAGVGHVYESKDDGGTWTDISANLPDIPVNDVVVLPDESLVVATDLGVVYRAAGQTQWTRLGSGLPATAVMDLAVGPDGNLYIGTHGRGLWRTALPAGSLIPPSTDTVARTSSTTTGSGNGGQPATGGKGHDKKPPPGHSKK